MSATLDDVVADQAGQLAGRIFEAAIATLEIGTIWVGLRLGLYDAVGDGATSSGLAAAAGVDERYAREWLEQQAIAGLLTVDDPTATAADRRYRLSPVQRLVLGDADSDAYVGMLPLLCGGILGVGDQVLAAFRSGGGVSFGEYGDDVRFGQGLFNKRDFLTNLTGPWLEAMPDVAAALGRADARVLDLGAGAGWSSIAFAQAFPALKALGVDSDEASVIDARINAIDAGVADRVTFETSLSDAPRAEASVDVALFMECLHDMAHPVEALTAVRRALRPGGRVVVMDELAEEAFAPDGTPLERLLGAASVLHCLPVGMSEPGSAGTGTMFRPVTMRRYATEAGYSDVAIAPIEHDFMRFYVLTP